MKNYVTLALVFLSSIFSSQVEAQEMFSPKEAAFTFDSTPFLEICEPNVEVLWRYLTGNPRWEVLKKTDFRSGGSRRIAIRMEDTKDPFRINGYQTSLNGFYVRERLQTRVLFSFRGTYGFGNDERRLTRVKLAESPNKQITVKPLLERADKYSYGHTSYLVLETPCHVTLEIMEQQLSNDRPFTTKTINEISQEVKKAIETKKGLELRGQFSDPQLYPVPVPQASTIEVQDGLQPGIYIVNAWIAQKEEGQAYVRVFRETDNKEVFKRGVLDKSLRTLGYDKTGKNLFRYTSEVTLSEGDWSSRYNARFEVWVESFDGKAPRKLLEASRLVNGWQR